MNVESFRDTYEDWNKSGLTNASYCEKTGMNKKRFHYWQAVMKREDSAKGNGVFITVSLADSEEPKARKGRRG